jgi:hypothetical protein
LDESLVILTLLESGLLEGGDTLEVRGKTVDDELVLLSELELVIRLQTRGVLSMRTII